MGVGVEVQKRVRQLFLHGHGSGYSCVVLPGFGWLGICVQRVEELTIGKIALPGACGVGRPYVVVVISHEYVVGLHRIQEEVYLLFVVSAGASRSIR